MHQTRTQFKVDSLLGLVRGVFKDQNQDKPDFYEIPTADCLMSALAMFSLKYPSLLQFDQDLNEKCLRHNLRTLYGVKKAPCDTRMRERLDGLSLSCSRLAMKALFARLQRGKVLERWKFMDQYYLVSLDGTGFFSSSQVHCSHCCQKRHSNGTITYSHQMVVGSIVHPDVRQVLPIGFEPIHKNDGAKKNDCERNASKRWLEDFRHQHPQLPTVIIADGLSANGPFLDLLEQYRCHYILVCQEKDHTYLWEWFWKAEKPDFTEIQETVGGVQKTYRFMKDVPLSDSRSDKRVTVIFYQEEHPNGQKKTWGWVTDLTVTPETVREIARGGRTRWKIENETFNTLKNQGYHFEHNFGHGKKTLSNVLAGLMLLAFLIDQCLEAVNLDFQKIMKKMKQRTRLWHRIRSGFQWVHIETWDAFYSSILDPPFLTL